MESSIMNVIIQLLGEDVWFTPPVSSGKNYSSHYFNIANLLIGCLPGVKRQELINSGILKERVITKNELINCYKV
jgi:branched-subunit amino acid aminotransferase/4-amino-4-deoxychorismate lyase